MRQTAARKGVRGPRVFVNYEKWSNSIAVFTDTAPSMHQLIQLCTLSIQRLGSKCKYLVRFFSLTRILLVQYPGRYYFDRKTSGNPIRSKRLA
jgi:hypothetical protein